MTRKAVSFVLALSLSFSLGCFVFEELDKSADLMDNPRFGDAPPSKQAPPPRRDAPVDRSNEAVAAVKNRLERWWGKARTLTSDEIDGDLVRCELGGSVEFMDRTQCLHRGGVPGRV